MKYFGSVSICAIGITFASAVGYAQQKADAPASPWTFTVGTKAWANTWTSWEITRVQSGGSSLQAVTTVSADKEIAYTPFASVRHGRTFVSVSAMGDTDYTLQSSLVSRTGTRSERDANVGYEIVSGLTFSAGYKKLVQDVGGRYEWSGPTLALSVSAPLHSGWSAYGTYGIGWMDVTLPSSDASGDDSLEADYALSEFGLAYSFGREHFGGVAGLTLTIGYRSQTVRTQDYALSSQPSGAVYDTDELRDFTQGIAFSVIGTF